MLSNSMLPRSPCCEAPMTPDDARGIPPATPTPPLIVIWPVGVMLLPLLPLLMLEEEEKLPEGNALISPCFTEQVPKSAESRCVGGDASWLLSGKKR